MGVISLDDLFHKIKRDLQIFRNFKAARDLEILLDSKTCEMNKESCKGKTTLSKYTGQVTLGGTCKCLKARGTSRTHFINSYKL